LAVKITFGIIGVPNVGAITAAATVVSQPASKATTPGNCKNRSFFSLIYNKVNLILYIHHVNFLSYFYNILVTLPIQAVNSNTSNTSTPATTTSTTPSAQHSQILTKRKLQDLLHEIDPTETMDDDVEEALLHMADDFIENVITASCQLAKHRRSNILDVKDVQLHLGNNI